jgi:hypothetical protein
LTVSRGASAVVGNIALGETVLSANISGANNTAIGNSTMQKNTTGWSNTAVGKDALNNNLIGNNSTAIGYQSLFNNTANSNDALGYQSMLNNFSGNSNVAIGQGSLKENYNGNNNTALGFSALWKNSAGSSNVAIGNYAGSTIADGTTNLTGINNSVIIGASAKAYSNSDTNEIVIGYNAIGNGSNSIQLGNTSVTALNTSGVLTTGTVTYPNTHNTTAGQVLTTNASGVASWATLASVSEADDQIIASASQASFVLSQTPRSISKVKMYVNGIRINKLAYSWSLVSSVPTLAYDSSLNGNYTITVGDRIQFEYTY